MRTQTAMQPANQSRQAWLVTLAASLYFFYEFIQMNFFNALTKPLMEAFQIGTTGLGYLGSFYFYANALFLFPAGMLLDRYSVRRLLLIAVTFTSIGTLIFAMAHSFAVAAIARIIVGTGASFCFLSCMRLASRWFPPEKMAFVTGVVVTMAMLGGLVAQTPMTFLAQALGWRTAVALDAALGVLIAVIIFRYVQDFPPGYQARTLHQQSSLSLWQSLRLVLRNPNNWLGGLYTSLVNLPVFLLGAMWGIYYLVEMRGMTQIQASWVTTLFFVGVIFGSPAFGWFSDKIGRRVLPMLLGAVLSLIVFLFLMYTKNLSYNQLAGLFFLTGFVTSSQVLSYPLIAELNPIALTSTAVSVDSITIMLSGAISQPFFGWIMSRHVTYDAAGAAIYSPHDFMNAMLIMPIAFVLAFFCAWCLKESYCRSQA